MKRLRVLRAPQSNNCRPWLGPCLRDARLLGPTAVRFAGVLLWCVVPCVEWSVHPEGGGGWQEEGRGGQPFPGGQSFSPSSCTWRGAQVTWENPWRGWREWKEVARERVLMETEKGAREAEEVQSPELGVGAGCSQGGDRRW